MEELFSSLFSDVFDGSFFGISDSPLSKDMIEESVDRMCDFFSIDKPYSVIEGESTAVNLGDRGMYGDEILFYNYDQLGEMGITGQDGLDLVMTHEGTHIMLQDMDTGFSSYQEELCCDYMAGVRAGLNGMDVSELENAFAGLGHDATHPDGSFRIDAIEDGLAFAKDYMATHELPPTFNECLEDFKGEHMQDVAELAHLKNEVIAHENTMAHYHRLVEMEPANETALHQYHESELNHERALYEYEIKQVEMDEKYNETDLEEKNDGETKGFINNKATHLGYAKDAKENAEYHEKRSKDFIEKGDLSAAKKHAELAASYRKQEKDEIYISKKCTK